MKLEVVLYLLKKANIPNATKAGLLISWGVFTLLDVKGKAQRFMDTYSPT